MWIANPAFHFLLKYGLEMQKTQSQWLWKERYVPPLPVKENEPIIAAYSDEKTIRSAVEVEERPVSWEDDGEVISSVIV